MILFIDTYVQVHELLQSKNESLCLLEWRLHVHRYTRPPGRHSLNHSSSVLVIYYYKLGNLSVAAWISNGAANHAKQRELTNYRISIDVISAK